MKRVCIAGTSRTLKQVPRDIPDLEFWVVTNMYKITKGYNRIFQIHQNKDLDETDINELSNIQVPVYMQDHRSDIPTSVKYPFDEVVKWAGRKLFQSSIDYMIALALYEGYEEIYLYGVDMTFAEEYGYQKPSCQYWLGRAEGMGVKIFLPDNCDLLKTYYDYGYQDGERQDFVLKAEAQIKELTQQSAQFNKNYYIAQGAKETWEFILRAVQKG